MTSDFIWPLFLTCLFAGLGWAFILKRKYTGPYTLKAASSTQKWRWAVSLALFETVPFLVFILSLFLNPLPTLSKDSNTRSLILVYCVLPVLATFPIAVLAERWGLERTLSNYVRMDTWRKDPAKAYLRGIWHGSVSRFGRALASPEYQQFLKDGYPD